MSARQTPIALTIRPERAAPNGEPPPFKGGPYRRFSDEASGEFGHDDVCTRVERLRRYLGGRQLAPWPTVPPSP